MTTQKTRNKASLMLLEKIEILRTAKLQDLVEGIHIEPRPYRYMVITKIQKNQPYEGCYQIRSSVKLRDTVLVESIFYRSE